MHSPPFPISASLQKKAHRLIPGGSHTYAKGDDQYPILAPGFIARGSGCHVWDVDGNEYIEYDMGNRAVGLGHAYPAVAKAVPDELERGCNFTRPSPIEVECAEAFLGLIDTAEMVKFCKNGSDATSAAVKLACAYTRRDYVAYCGDHPFFSVDDWFIGPTPMGAGIPEPNQAYRSLFLQEIIRRGVVEPSLTASYAHSDEDIDKTTEAIGCALDVYTRSLEEGAEKYLVGRPSQIVQRRYNQPETASGA